MSFSQFNTYPGLTPIRLVATSNQSGTYFNGTSNNGVDATFTYATGSTTIDSVTPNIGDRIAFVGQSLGFQNGIYVVTQSGATGVSLILQRSADFQNIEQMFEGQFFSVAAGTVNAGVVYTLVEPMPSKIGVSNIVFVATPNAGIGLGTAATKAASNNSDPTVASVNGTTTAGNILASADTAGTVTDGGLAANKVLTSTITTPDISIDLVSFDVSVTAAALASGGNVVLIPASSSKQYKIRILQMSANLDFSGGGGNRLGNVTDGVTAYSLIPAATMQSLVNSAWGSTNLPFPGLNLIDQSTNPGSPLVFQYNGGTTDYTQGILQISGVAQRVA